MRSPDYVPQLTRHKATGQAVVRLYGCDIYLSRFGAPAAKPKYDQLITD